VHITMLICEFGFGAALLSDKKYGFSVHENMMRMSLLRSSKKPDDTADMGQHNFKFGFYPHKGTFSEVNLPRLGYEFNQPLLLSTSATQLTPVSFMQLNVENLMVEAVKRAEGPLQNDIEDAGDRNMIVRVWETMGGRGTAKLVLNHLPVKAVTRCNLLEETGNNEPMQLVQKDSQTTLEFRYKPFEIITFKCLL